VFACCFFVCSPEAFAVLCLPAWRGEAGLIVYYEVLSEYGIVIRSAGEDYFFFAYPVTVGLEEFVYFLFECVCVDNSFVSLL
jgi:hypothetical protein